MDDAAGNVKADDVPIGVNPRRSGGRGAWGIDGGEGALMVAQEAKGTRNRFLCVVVGS